MSRTDTHHVARSKAGNPQRSIPFFSKLFNYFFFDISGSMQAEAADLADIVIQQAYKAAGTKPVSWKLCKTIARRRRADFFRQRAKLERFAAKCPDYAWQPHRVPEDSTDPADDRAGDQVWPLCSQYTSMAATGPEAMVVAKEAYEHILATISKPLAETFAIICATGTCDPATIATELDISETCARQRLHRLRSAVRTIIDNNRLRRADRGSSSARRKQLT